MGVGHYDEAGATMTEKQLDEIEARARAASGPWIKRGGDKCDSYTLPFFVERPRSDDEAYGLDVFGDEALEADVEFAVHARTDIPLLLAEVRRLRDECERLRGEAKG